METLKAALTQMNCGLRESKKKHPEHTNYLHLATKRVSGWAEGFPVILKLNYFRLFKRFLVTNEVLNTELQIINQKVPGVILLYLWVFSRTEQKTQS